MDLAKDLSNLKEFVSQQKITKIDPAKLTKHPTNDFHDIEGEQWEKFKDSIDSIGIIHPIIIDTRNRVLSGWQRTRAASILGLSLIHISERTGPCH
jgi:ParB-like chromosome segregation protein Spo0J